jgi:hypothetical protein
MRCLLALQTIIVQLGDAVYIAFPFSAKPHNLFVNKSLKTIFVQREVNEGK